MPHGRLHSGGNIGDPRKAPWLPHRDYEQRRRWRSKRRALEGSCCSVPLLLADSVASLTLIPSCPVAGFQGVSQRRGQRACESGGTLLEDTNDQRAARAARDILAIVQLLLLAGVRIRQAVRPAVRL
eukprot:4532302-Prymnesium_polylepis.2